MKWYKGGWTEDLKTYNYFLEKVKRYVRKRPQYKALVDLGLREVDIPRADGENYHQNEVDFDFCSEVIGPQHEFVEYVVCYHSVYINGDEEVRQNTWNRHGHRNKRSYKKMFYRVVNGILIGMERLHSRYSNRIMNSNVGEELEFLNNIPKINLPLYIRHKWKSKYVKNIFLGHLKSCV